MSKSFKNIFISLIAFIAIASLWPVDSYAEYGANIEATNCDPAADPASDYLRNDKDSVDGVDIYKYRSCSGQNIGPKEFKVNLKFNPPTDDFIAAYIGANLVPLIAFFGYRYWSAYNAAFGASMGSCTAACVAATLGATAASCAPGCTAGAVEAGEKAGFTTLVVGVTATVAESAQTAAISKERGDTYIGIGTTTDILKGPIGPIAIAEARIVGDKVCVYLQSRPIPFLNFLADRSNDFNKKYNIGENSPLASQKNCVYMPAFAFVQKPTVPPFISQSCVDYESSSTMFRWPQKDASGNYVRGDSRSFTGVVVQCVEDTMMNLFFSKHGGDTKTIFEKTQDNLKGMMKAMLVLYVIMIGLKYTMYNGEIKQNDFIMIMLKIGFIWYFAAGPGVSSLLPGIIGSIKEVSAIVIEATAGSSNDKVTTKSELDAALNNFNTKKFAYSSARINWAKWAPASAGATVDLNGKTKAQLQTIMDDAKVAKDDAQNVYESKRMKSLSFGYKYCDFSPFVNAAGGSKYNYTTTVREETVAPYDAVTPAPGSVIPVGGTLTRNMDYMRLWDGIDCRLAKFLGVGTDIDYPSAPNILLIGIGSIFGGAIGIVVFCLVFIFLVFVILIVVRIVHIYLIAFIAIVLLAYISPLVIPMMLFEYTKSAFDSWFKQFTAYIVQPIILFSFLALMFAIFDNIMFGNNYEFNPADNTKLVTAPTLNDNTIRRIQDRNGKWVCQDQDVLGCFYDRIGTKLHSVEIAGAPIFAYYTLFRKDIKTELDFPPYSNSNPVAANVQTSSYEKGGDLSDHEYTILMVELLKIILACFVINAMLGQVQEMSAKLTNAAGGGGLGAAGLSATPTSDPGKIANATLVPGIKNIGSLAGKGIGKLAKAASRTARRRGIK